MPAQIEQVLHSGMSTNESLSLPHRFEPPHPSLSNPGSLCMANYQFSYSIRRLVIAAFADEYYLCIANYNLANDMMRLAIATHTDEYYHRTG